MDAEEKINYDMATLVMGWKVYPFKDGWDYASKPCHDNTSFRPTEDDELWAWAWAVFMRRHFPHLDEKSKQSLQLEVGAILVQEDRSMIRKSMCECMIAHNRKEPTEQGEIKLTAMQGSGKVCGNNGNVNDE